MISFPPLERERGSGRHNPSLRDKLSWWSYRYRYAGGNPVSPPFPPSVFAVVIAAVTSTNRGGLCICPPVSKGVTGRQCMYVASGSRERLVPFRPLCAYLPRLRKCLA